MSDWEDREDRPHEECGAFGIYAPGQDVARITFFGLYALQHRGQESAGIATLDGSGQIGIHRRMGLVAQVFDESDLLGLQGDIMLIRLPTMRQMLLRLAIRHMEAASLHRGLGSITLS